MIETARLALQRATALLNMAGIDGAERDARILLAFALGVDRVQLGLRLDEPLPNSAARQFDQIIAMRGHHKPVSHITGKRDFWAHEFLVTDDVLDPRPDTETLVALALEQPFERLLDMGTGSGIIALSLLAERPSARGIASDICDKALDVARRNAVRLRLSDRVQFITSNWFEQVQGRFDLIISNPPYISEAEMANLAPDVANWEPHLALTPGGDGLEAYRRIAQDLPDYLTRDGRAIFEIGFRQAGAVKKIFTNAGFEKVQIYQDLSGHDRIVAINASFTGK